MCRVYVAWSRSRTRRCWRRAGFPYARGAGVLRLGPLLGALRAWPCARLPCLPRACCGRRRPRKQDRPRSRRTSGPRPSRSPHSGGTAGRPRAPGARRGRRTWASGRATCPARPYSSRATMLPPRTLAASTTLTAASWSPRRRAPALAPRARTAGASATATAPRRAAAGARARRRRPRAPHLAQSVTMASTAATRSCAPRRPRRRRRRPPRPRAA